MTGFDSSLSAGYTVDGLRAWKQGTSGKTYFLYDGSVPVCELDGSGNVRATNTWGANGLLSRRDQTGNTFYTFDWRGNPAQRFNVYGQSLLTQFDAYGASKSLGDTNANAAPDPYAGFGSQWGGYTDSETGLVLMGHRYYDPQQGRFLTRDPLGLAGGMNAYRYADNDPISLIDPSGLSPFSDWYWGGMGGLSNLADQGLMNGSVGNLGTVAGEHDSGCVSNWELAKAGLNVAGNAAMLVIPGGGEAEVGLRVTQTGARTVVQELARIKAAEAAYDKIRAADDVATIAENSGLRQGMVQRAKDHLFNDLQPLDNGRVDRFDPDPDIAQAWQRLQEGTHSQDDIGLIYHEYAESRYMNIFGTDYSTAHNAVVGAFPVNFPE